ncbi:hypothetical protein A5S48_14705 [Listeria monocytogenes]|nr:hypothetical protein [Listeria monocytogenes]EAF9520462.1 hypothetical protein [Listeria monocytogenes]EDN8735495.1 hypothetical protein [Listeria monocytogenes]
MEKYIEGQQGLYKHLIKFTFMFGEYSGHVTLTISGNVCGWEALTAIDPERFYHTERFKENPIGLNYSDEWDLYRMRLKNQAGEDIYIDAITEEELKDMIVSIEFIDWESEEA